MSLYNDNKKNEKEKDYSWVYSLPFFPKLLKRIKIILLIHLSNKSKLIKLIQKQRLNAISTIIKAYKKFKLINRIKKEYFLQKIISDRKKAIIKLQNYIKYFLLKLKLKKIIRKEKKSYTIICNKSNVTKIFIRIFTDYNDINKSMIFQMKYCPIRNYFVFPIPKTKFVSAEENKKIVRFIFLYRENIFFDEENYKLVDFKGKKVHEINFSDYDKIFFEKSKINIDEETNGLSYLRQKSSLFNNNYDLDFSSDEEYKKKNSRKTTKDLNDTKKKKFERNKKKGKTCKLKKPTCLKIISILKERNYGRRKTTMSDCRHVQFGTVSFSY